MENLFKLIKSALILTSLFCGQLYAFGVQENEKIISTQLIILPEGSDSYYSIVSNTHRKEVVIYQNSLKNPAKTDSITLSAGQSESFLGLVEFAEKNNRIWSKSGPRIHLFNYLANIEVFQSNAYYLSFFDPISEESAYFNTINSDGEGRGFIFKRRLRLRVRKAHLELEEVIKSHFGKTR